MPAEVFDEEEVLGFAIWVAELELLVGGRGTQASDAADYFHLLQKLLVTVERDERDIVREYQRRCDDKLHDLIVAGAPAPVRRLASAVLAKLYTVGDNLPLYSRTNGLLSMITARDVNQRSVESRAGVLECLAALCAHHGRQLSTRMPEVVAAAAKHVGRYSIVWGWRVVLVSGSGVVVCACGVGHGVYTHAYALIHMSCADNTPNHHKSNHHIHPITSNHHIHPITPDHHIHPITPNYTEARNPLYAWLHCVYWQHVYKDWGLIIALLLLCRRLPLEPWISRVKKKGLQMCGMWVLWLCMRHIHHQIRTINTFNTKEHRQPKPHTYTHTHTHITHITHRLACAAVITAIAEQGGVGIWANGAALFSEAVTVCTAALDDPNPAVGGAFAGALGALAASAQADAALAVLKVQTKTRAVVLQRVLGDAVNTCMVAPFVVAASVGNKVACSACVQVCGKGVFYAVFQRDTHMRCCVQNIVYMHPLKAPIHTHAHTHTPTHAHPHQIYTHTHTHHLTHRPG